MTSTSRAGLAAFLTARLDDDENLARKTLATAQARWGIALRVSTIARWQRTLREVAAKRAILAVYLKTAGIEPDDWGEDPAAVSAYLNLEAVQHLAAVYAEHPDYDPDWAPA